MGRHRIRFDPHKRARMGQRRRRHDLGAFDKRPQDQPVQPARLLPLGHAPGVEFRTIRQRQALGKLAMKCRGGGFQRLRRGGIDARCQGAPYGHDIHLDVGNIDPNAIAFRNDPRAARAVHDGTQLAQGRAQGPARIIRDVPEDRTEPASPMSAPGGHEISEQRADFPGGGQQEALAPSDDFDFTQKSNAQLNRFGHRPDLRSRSLFGLEAVPIRPGAWNCRQFGPIPPHNFNGR